MWNSPLPKLNPNQKKDMAIIATKEGTQYVKITNTEKNTSWLTRNFAMGIESVSVSGTTVIVKEKNTPYVYLFDGNTGGYITCKRI